MTRGNSVMELAPAKVNLWLRILARRTDGYHELESLMLALQLGDELHARATGSGGVQLTVSGPAASSDIPQDDGNLVWQVAAAALERGRELGALSIDSGVALELVKYTPSRAGLGGGSSDAAATLRALQRLWGVDLGEAWCRARLAAAGADCVFFHSVGEAGVAHCSGIGEQVVALAGPPPEWHVLVVTPEAECPTGAIFGAWRASPEQRGPMPALNSELTLGPAAELRGSMENDLEVPAIEVVPELARWREVLDDEGLAHARLAGSGSSFFALFDTGEEAHSAAERVDAAAGEAGLASRLLSVTRALRER